MKTSSELRVLSELPPEAGAVISLIHFANTCLIFTETDLYAAGSEVDVNRSLQGLQRVLMNMPMTGWYRPDPVQALGNMSGQD